MLLYNNKKKICVSVIYSLLFSISTVLGHALYYTNDLKKAFSTGFTVIRAMAVFIVLWLISTVAVMLLLLCIEKIQIRQTPSGHHTTKVGKKFFLIIWLIIFVSWIPCFIAYYPGIYSYDIVGQINQITTSEYSSHHPPLHTFVFKICMDIRSSIGLADISVYAVFQMLFLSFAMARLICCMKDKGASHKGIILSVLFFSLNPLIAIASLLPIKDVFCAAFMILMTVSLFEMITNTEEFFDNHTAGIRLMFEVLGVCLFRNNAVYAVVIAVVVIALILKKKLKKWCCCCQFR